jgi:hypothetical protein
LLFDSFSAVLFKASSSVAEHTPPCRWPQLRQAETLENNKKRPKKWDDGVGCPASSRPSARARGLVGSWARGSWALVGILTWLGNWAFLACFLADGASQMGPSLTLRTFPPGVWRSLPVQRLTFKEAFSCFLSRPPNVASLQVNRRHREPVTQPFPTAGLLPPY